jgi:hypothetical protein
MRRRDSSLIERENLTAKIPPAAHEIIKFYSFFVDWTHKILNDTWPPIGIPPGSDRDRMETGGGVSRNPDYMLPSLRDKGITDS